jgi:hypothetical protein
MLISPSIILHILIVGLFAGAGCHVWSWCELLSYFVDQAYYQHY